jgi:hypothetical protein
MAWDDLLTDRRRRCEEVREKSVDQGEAVTILVVTVGGKRVNPLLVRVVVKLLREKLRRS